MRLVVALLLLLQGTAGIIISIAYSRFTALEEANDHYDSELEELTIQVRVLEMQVHDLKVGIYTKINDNKLEVGTTGGRHGQKVNS